MDYTYIDISEGSKLPIFEQIANGIIKNIELGNLQAGDKLPTERQLSEYLKVSRGTVKSAYKRLENHKIIEIIQGSGSYVLKNKVDFSYHPKKEAYEIITSAFSKLEAMDLSSREILNLVNLYLSSKNSVETIHIAIVDDNQEALLDFKRQLSYLSNISVSIFILESITVNPDPEKILEDFDIIITHTTHFSEISELIPNLKERIIEAAIAPSKQTLIEIAAVKRDARIGIVCRTDVFLNIIIQTLLTYGFKSENIFSFFEINYTTKTYFPGGIDALISFSEAHIFTDSSFEYRNIELLNKGGKIIKFEYEIERGTLIYIEDRINKILKSYENN